MTVSRDDVMAALAGIRLPGGGDLVSRDMVRAVTIEESTVRFVIEAATPDEARLIAPLQAQAESAVRALAGVSVVHAVTTAHGPAAKPAAPSLKIGQHPTPQQGGPQKLAGIDRIIAIGSGKGGVGKSTVSSNLAVALARQGRRVGLLDADIYGPSQPRMMGVSRRPGSPDGKIIEP
ncbi:P-loop NTPase, partial [Pseudotabrizicola sp.]|uniref:P-loop NTPase n=1 Tax=Pseudotabrizicola sp. TaxID=2939647 RepID=UPI0027234726